MATRPKYMHALLTSEKPSIRYGRMDFCTNYDYYVGGKFLA